MEAAEPKTPLKAPKKYKRSKKASDTLKMEEFMSYGSSDYFSHLDNQDEEVPDQIKEGSANEDIPMERQIEEWLLKKGIFRAAVSEKKEVFFEEKRNRVNSISYFVESDSTDGSPNNKSETPMSLQLSPHNSKICRKRSNFTSLSNIDIMSASKAESSRAYRESRYSDQKPLSYPINEEEESPNQPSPTRPEGVRPPEKCSH